MKYNEALQTLGKNFDPFLHILKNEIIDETEWFFVVPSRAPYVKNHLLVIPKRKVYLLKDLKENEKIEMFKLLEKWTTKLHKIHPDINLLLRDGLVWWKTGKSVNHLHFHLIPDCSIWAEWQLNSIERKWYDETEYEIIVKEIKSNFC